jgi:hypothetical protein
MQTFARRNMGSISGRTSNSASIFLPPCFCLPGLPDILGPETVFDNAPELFNLRAGVSLRFPN